MRRLVDFNRHKIPYWLKQLFNFHDLNRSGAPSNLHKPNSSLISTSTALKRKSCSDAENTNTENTNNNTNFAYSAPSFKKLAENITKKSKNQNKHDNYDAKQFRSAFRKPLESTLNKLAVAKTSTHDTSKQKSDGNDGALSSSQKAHEAFIKNLLNPKFKIPLPNYISTSTRALGIKRQGTRQPVYDLDSENVLILYAPPVLSATELLNVDK